MAGTPDNFVVSEVIRGPGKAYSGLAVPAASARLLLDDDGTPDSGQNPNALHLGMTEGGTAWSVKPTFTNHHADEFLAPIIIDATDEEAVISGSLLQLGNMDIAEALMPTGTRSDLAGTTGMTFGGSGNVSYQSVAVIAPIEGSSSPVVYMVFHLYKCINDAGLAAQITSKKLNATPFAFRGVAIASRAEGDKVGRYFIQNAGAVS